MAPSSKQADRKLKQKGSKQDDEPVEASAAGGAAIAAAAKQLVLGSVLAEIGPMVPTLLKGASIATTKAAEKKDSNEETKDEAATSDDAVKGEEKPQDAASVFEELIERLPVYNTLGLDKAPEEGWLLFKGLEVDFGPFKRKKGNAALERICVNVERNMSQYLHILLALMCLRALVFRSWFACLPWLVGYQLLSMNLPMDLIMESFPQVPPVDSNFRVAATLGFHVLVWLFFLYEILYKSYILEKFPLIALVVAHAYVAAPQADPEAARKAIAEKTEAKAKAAQAEPQPVASKDHVATMLVTAKQLVNSSVLAKLSPTIIGWVKEIKTVAGKSEEKKEDEDAKTTDNTSIFEDLKKGLSPFNMLGLGLLAPEVAKESWLALKSLQLDFGPETKKSGAVKERILTNVSRNMPQYLHILLAMMSLRSFLFRSWFACLPWLLLYQMVSVNIPFDVVSLLRAKFPQVPPVDFKVRVVATFAIHALMWFFFLYEAVYKTYFLEKIPLLGLFIAHAYLVSPVPN